MTPTPDELDDLIGAWALDAIDADMRAVLEQAMAGDPALAARASALREVVASLGESLATPAPEALKVDLLTTVASDRRTPPTATDPITLYANQVTALESLLASLDTDDWTLPAAPYRWTVQQLVAHLGVIDAYTARTLDLSDESRDPTALGHLELGADTIAAAARQAPGTTVRRWNAAATAVIDAMQSEDAPSLDASVELHGWPMSVEGALVARAFETWTHTDDIRRATGRPVAAPSPADLGAMSTFSVGTLPLVFPLVADGEPFTGARVVLTGEGGGTFDLGDPQARQTLLVTDVVGYCRLAARRVAVPDLDVTIEGDPAIAHHLLAAAQVFAV